MAPGGSLVTIGVRAETATDDPAGFEPFTTSSSVAPASADVSVYVCADALAMVWQWPPELSQRFHVRLYEIGCVPLQLPIEPTTVLPTRALGALMLGLVTLTGAAA